MEIDIKNKDKIGKLVTVILVGILLLVIALPVKRQSGTENSRSVQNSDGTTENYGSYADYYEKKLKSILEHSYGEGTMEVMVHLAEEEQAGGLYGSGTQTAVVDGVLVVADVHNEQAVSDITFAVCALFDLPAHKVAVMIKN